eukprot:4643360-Pleurochrysis_carterae.AAC.2
MRSHHRHHHLQLLQMTGWQLAKMSGQCGASGFQQLREQDGTSCMEHELMRGTRTPQSISIFRTRLSHESGEVLECHGGGTLWHPSCFEPLEHCNLPQADNAALGARIVERKAQSSCCEAQLSMSRVAKP